MLAEMEDDEDVELMDPDDPVPMGKKLTITAWCESNWGHDLMTRKSITGMFTGRAHASPASAVPRWKRNWRD